jgi:hypothetical protein
MLKKQMEQMEQVIGETNGNAFSATFEDQTFSKV